VPAVEQRVRNIEKVWRDEEKGQVTHRRTDALDNSFGQLDKRVVILMRDLDNSFKNELEKMKDNEARITHQLREIGSGLRYHVMESPMTLYHSSSPIPNMYTFIYQESAWSGRSGSIPSETPGDNRTNPTKPSEYAHSSAPQTIGQHWCQLSP
jgi:hypothetical protein